jgi:hypothetical protein
MTEKRRYAVGYGRVSREEIYKFTSEDWQGRKRPKESNQFRRAIIWRSLDNGQTWQEVPLRLDLRSRVIRWMARGCYYWPPNFIDDLEPGERGRISIIFHDPDPWEGSSPSDWDAPSVWRAVYMPGKRRWRLERIRVLDYEGADADLKPRDAERLGTPPPDEGPPP